jgi:hypothetical protein
VDKVIDGCDEHHIHTWLREISPSVQVNWDWQPQRPHTYIAAQLRLDQQLQRRQAVEATPCTWPNQAFVQAARHLEEPISGEAQPELEDIDALPADAVSEMRNEAWTAYKSGDVALVVTAVDGLGLAAAQRLYGPGLVHRALNLASNDRIRIHATVA